MKRLTLPIFTVLLCGCTETVSRSELNFIMGREMVSGALRLSLPEYHYTGQDEKYQYVRRQWAWHLDRRFRVPTADNLGYEPFPPTSDESKWKPYIPKIEASDFLP